MRRHTQISRNTTQHSTVQKDFLSNLCIPKKMKANKFSSTLRRRQIFMNWHQHAKKTQRRKKKNWKHCNHINKLSCESIFVCRRVKHEKRHHLKMCMPWLLCEINKCRILLRCKASDSYECAELNNECETTVSENFIRWMLSRTFVDSLLSIMVYFSAGNFITNLI